MTRDEKQEKDGPRRTLAPNQSVLRNISLLKRIFSNLDFVSAALDREVLLKEVMRLELYFNACDRERYWLEEALASKEEILTVLSQKKAADEKMQVFKRQLADFRAASAALHGGSSVLDEDLLPIISDAVGYTPFDRHYIYHPAWAARIIAATKPEAHIDISSILAFSTIVSAFVPTTFYDFRPAKLELSGLRTQAADLTALPFKTGSVTSLSCMHVIEHIGLGRYGDPIDPTADQKSISELVRVLAPGGNLLVATPVGRERVQFNAHRVYDPVRFSEKFKPLELVEFTLIEENGERGPVHNADMVKARDNNYACGCYWFRKVPV